MALHYLSVLVFWIPSLLIVVASHVGFCHEAWSKLAVSPELPRRTTGQLPPSVLGPSVLEEGFIKLVTYR